MGTTNIIGRMGCSLGGMEAADPVFQPCLDIPNGGVLLALPALLANGLLFHTDQLFKLPRGFYSLYSIFLCITFMLLARMRSAEELRYCAPGEWGKLLGLDRVPEVKTMRKKVDHLARNGEVKEWSSALCQDWMKERPEEAAFLYVDGHVRVYHGHKALLPKHYVARQKLCLHATCDYWVNAMNGSPFFLLTKDIDPGLLQVIEHDIVPRLEQEIPNQPSQLQLSHDPFLHRFVLIFDREGYSPDFIKKMKEKRIACLTYNKFPKENWPDNEFISKIVTLNSGEEIEMQLAERGVFLRNKVWVSEIRRQMSNGHQTSILSTAHRLPIDVQAASMFARWSQENFFKYMRRHFSLDKLAEYSVDEIPQDTKVVNPKYRSIDGLVRSKRGVLYRRLAEFGAITIDGELGDKKVLKYQGKKARLQDEISHLEQELEELKKERKEIPKHIQLGELPEDQRLNRLRTHSKDFLDTLKMIAYRAETAMANTVRESLSSEDQARSFVRSLYQTEVDIIPDNEKGILRIQLHRLANRNADQVAANLCEVLNATETIFPGSKLRLVYEMVSQ